MVMILTRLSSGEVCSTTIWRAITNSGTPMAQPDVCPADFLMNSDSSIKAERMARKYARQSSPSGSRKTGHHCTPPAHPQCAAQ